MTALIVWPLVKASQNKFKISLLLWLKLIWASTRYRVPNMEQVNCLEKQCLYLQGSWIFSNAIERAGFNVCVPSTKPYNQSLIEYQLFTQYNRSHFVFYHLFGFISVCFGVITVIYPECLCYKIRVCKYLYQHIDTFFHCRVLANIFSADIANIQFGDLSAKYQYRLKYCLNYETNMAIQSSHVKISAITNIGISAKMSYRHALNIKLRKLLMSIFEPNWLNALIMGSYASISACFIAVVPKDSLNLICVHNLWQSERIEAGTHFGTENQGGGL